jgi:site-specific recombinase XerD
MNELLMIPASQSPELGALAELTAKFICAAKACSTRKAYAADLADFQRFAIRHSLPFLPSTPETVVLYIVDLASRLSVATIRRRMAAITSAHREAGYTDSPASPRRHYVVREVLAGMKRTLGTAQQGTAPLLTGDIRRIVAATPDNLLGLRDRALVLVGFSGAFRRGELTSILEVEDLAFTESGLYIRLRRSKTDQEQQGRNVAVPLGEHPETCPVRALRSWLEAAVITSGPVFRSVDRHGHVAAHALSPRSIAKILKCAATRAGIDATLIAGHSLRAGMVTQAALNGAQEREIARTTGHHSEAMVRRYIRVADPFRAIAATQLGL